MIAIAGDRTPVQGRPRRPARFFWARRRSLPQDPLVAPICSIVRILILLFCVRRGRVYRLVHFERLAKRSSCRAVAARMRSATGPGATPSGWRLLRPRSLPVEYNFFDFWAPKLRARRGHDDLGRDHRSRSGLRSRSDAGRLARQLSVSSSRARCALLEKSGFGYRRMSETGYIWHGVVDMRIRVRPAAPAWATR